MDSLFIVVPAYNEEANIETVVRQWYPILSNKGKDSRLIIADSGSSDNTHNILIKLQKELPKLEVLMNTNKEHGPKIMALYDYAVKQGADYIFQTDSDGQTTPDEFGDFWQLRSQYDGILGHRNARGDGKSRVFVEYVVCFLLKLYFGVNIPDANAPFRLMKADMVKKHLYRLPPDYNISNIMLTAYFAYYNEKIIFKTISFQARQKGKNSINIPRIIKIGWKALGDFRQLKKEITDM